MSGYSQSLTRRAFLSRTIKAFFAALTVGVAALSALVLYPAGVRRKELEFIPVCSEDELPVLGVRQFPLRYRSGDNRIDSRIFIVRTVKGLFALSPVCTHLGCLVTWHRVKDRFLCPCHGGQYDIEGAVVAGPPPAPLNRLPLRIENETVFVGMKV